MLASVRRRVSAGKEKAAASSAAAFAHTLRNKI
jgi:hypothetical protein